MSNVDISADKTVDLGQLTGTVFEIKKTARSVRREEGRARLDDDYGAMLWHITRDIRAAQAS